MCNFAASKQVFMSKYFNKKRLWIISVLAIFLIIAIGCIVVYNRVYDQVYGANLSISSDEPVFVFIPTGSDFEDVCSILKASGLQNMESFRSIAERMNYTRSVRAGRYRLLDRMSNIELVRMLRSGRQAPVNVIFNNIRVNEQLAGTVSAFIEADSASIIALLNDDAFLLEHYSRNSQTIKAMCIPNTYEFFWNTSAKGFLDRMLREYERFWSESRLEKAQKANLTPLQVSILASIIEEETQKDSEKPRMAGVYINRLNRGMLLQADPTLKFALNDFTIRRVLNRHKEIDSPYNTYKYTGLPPGPICCPSIASIDAVLNFEQHQYLFFCARDDFSGYHSFARTLQEHNRNAQAYHRALNERRVF